MTLVLLVADGARPDAFPAAIDAGHLPALARLRAAGSAHTITTVFPSVTGPAYLPFLTGWHPGDAGIPGIRWWDRGGRHVRTPGGARSYVGIDALLADGDLDTRCRTLFEAEPDAIAAFAPFTRGLPRHRRLDGSPAAWLRLAWHHFRGDLPGWLALERAVADRFATRVARERPAVAFLALPGIDKVSHALGADAPEVLDAMRVVDGTVERLTDDAERAGRGEALAIWIVSDHGHAPVAHHDDLADALRDAGYGARAHPWAWRGGDDISVMVGGNGMAHLYLDLARPTRPWWPTLAPHRTALVDWLLARPSVDLVLLPLDPARCAVCARTGNALVWRDAAGRHHYRRETGDPLCLDADTPPNGLDAEAAHDGTLDGAYPDALVQIIALAGAARSGDVIVSATPQWDFRERYEPVPHRSSHGALHREHMRVPFFTSHPVRGTPRRTVDVFPSALARLGRSVPDAGQGRSFL
ncbi:MAG: alkaline phosphatase family protein [Gemmatimonadota bacterium]